MKRSSLVCMLVICCLLSPITEAKASEELPTLVRLHVLANSESLRDQQAKIRVRDELLAYLEPLLRGVAERDDAVTIIKANLTQLTAIAETSLEQQGETYGASLQIGQFNFPAKHYGTFTLPAGRYQALNVTLGAGEGRNWWCVVFPPLCLTSEVCRPEQQTAANTFVIRSWLFEWWGGVRSWLARERQ